MAQTLRHRRPPLARRDPDSSPTTSLLSVTWGCQSSIVSRLERSVRTQTVEELTGLRWGIRWVDRAMRTPVKSHHSWHA